jgi:hypothetical protein
MAKAATKNRAAKAAASATVRPAPKPKVAAATKTVAKPTVQMHTFSTEWSGASDAVNQNVSRTPIDSSRFGTLLDAKMTERDIKNLAAMRAQFGHRQFERGNLDAGILRRLGERGYVTQVSGGHNDANAVFKLTNRKA